MNLKELSEKLNLSQTTVSRALNGYTDVSEATRQRVAEMAQKHGYKPNPVARRLAIGKADAIGLVYPLDATYLGDPRFLEVMESLSSRINEERMDVLIASEGKGNGLETYQRLIRAHRVDGLIVARTYLEDPRIRFLMKAKFPFVSYGRTADSSGFAWFDFDNELGARLAVERLISLGHRRIGYIHAALDHSFSAQRYQGFVASMLAAGLSVNGELVREAGVQRQRAYDVVRTLLDRPDRPTAILVDNNQAGVGALRALLESGLSLGRDCSLIVYDGLPEDTLLDVQDVTFVEQPTPSQVGIKLAELMLGVIRGDPVSQLQVLWKPRLHIGLSDGKAPS